MAQTADYIQKWNGTALTDSQLFDNGTNVGIGTSSPGVRLDLGAQAPGAATPFGYWRAYGVNNAWPFAASGINSTSFVDHYLVFNGQLTGGSQGSPTFYAAPNAGAYIGIIAGTPSRLEMGVIPGGTNQTPTPLVRLNCDLEQVEFPNDLVHNWVTTFTQRLGEAPGIFAGWRFDKKMPPPPVNPAEAQQHYEAVAGLVWSIDSEPKWGLSMDIEDSDFVLAYSFDLGGGSGGDLLRVSQDGRFTLGDGAESPQDLASIFTVQARNGIWPMAIQHWANNRYGLIIHALNSGTANNTSAKIDLYATPSNEIGYSGHIELFGSSFPDIHDEFWIYTAGSEQATPLVLGTLGQKRVQIEVTGAIGIKDVSSHPEESFPGGEYLYVEDGALKFKGGSGTVTPIAPA